MKEPINEARWQQLSQDMMTEMRAWRLDHPKATLRAIETALDARLNRMRARLLEDLVLAAPAADWTDTPRLQHPTCPDCGTPLQLRGSATRTLQTHGGQDLSFWRRYGSCPACGVGLFPPR